MIQKNISRRKALNLLGYAGIGIVGTPAIFSIFNKNEKMISRVIPASGEKLPVVGLGTWQSFDVGNSDSARATLTEVLQLMQQHGGKLIDSSPMYGSSERVVGDLTQQTGSQTDFFYATKVWTTGQQSGMDQMNDSMRKMKRQTMDLMQIHNLTDWTTHLQTLRKWKEKGKIRYLGITHYTIPSHSRLEQIIKSEDIDFVQFNYSIQTRNAEQSLLKAARDNGVAVIINRPYEGGSLFRKAKGKSLPEWASEYQITSWGQFFLKYILSHPAVNCVIPGTSKPHHLVDNMKAGFGPMPDDNVRKKMVRVMEGL